MPSWGPLEILVILAILVIGVLGTIFWVLMLVDCLADPTRPPDRKIPWAVAIAISHFLGATLYYFLEKKNRSLLPSRVG